MIYARNNIAVALKEGSKRFEHLHRRLDGTNFSAEVLLDALMLEGKKVLQARVYDITERKQLYEELAKHRDHLEELVKKRTKELEEKYKEVERMNNLFAGREFRIKELKDKIKKLEKK
jgi:DNA-binding HxlR family transcriptional regulator